MFRYTTIRSKLLILVSIFLVLMIVLALFNIIQMGKLGKQLSPESSFQDSLSIIIVFSVLTILVGLIIGVSATRSITKHLTATIKMAHQLAEGKHDINFEVPFKDETGRVLEAMQHMSLSIKDTEKSLKGQAEKLADINESLKKEIAERKVAEEALRKSQQYARNIIDSSLDMIIAVDTERYIIEFNKAAQKSFGYGPKEVLGKHIDMLYADMREASVVYQNTVKTGQSVKEISNRRKNGEEFPCLLAASILHDVHGSPIGFMGISRDITEQKRSEEMLRQHNQELNLLSQLSELLQACRTEKETYRVMESLCTQFFPWDSGYLAIIDDSRTTLDIVSSWGEAIFEDQMFGIDDCWALRRGKIHFVEPHEVGPLCSHLHRSATHGYLCAPISASGEILGILHLSFGQYETTWSTRQPDDMRESRRMVATRIAEHYALSLANLRLRETLKHDAIRDELTGMYNRRYMEGSLDRETRRAERRKTSVGIIMLDVDYFKSFNDTHGHDAGDMVLRELGVFLRKNTRGDDLACRYGGEEFLLIMPDASLQNAKQRAEDLRKGIQNLNLIYQEKSLLVTISAGVASIPEHGDDVRDAVKAADAALYQAKQEGRNRIMIATKI